MNWLCAEIGTVDRDTYAVEDAVVAAAVLEVEAAIGVARLSSIDLELAGALFSLSGRLDLDLEAKYACDVEAGVGVGVGIDVTVAGTVLRDAVVEVAVTVVVVVALEDVERDDDSRAFLGKSSSRCASPKSTSIPVFLVTS